MHYIDFKGGKRGFYMYQFIHVESYSKVSAKKIIKALKEAYGKIVTSSLPESLV